jgi:hypothetical protein
MYNRGIGASGFTGPGAGVFNSGNGSISDVVQPHQFNGFYNGTANSSAQGFANDLWNGNPPQGGNVGNSTYFAAPVSGNASWAQPNAPLFDPNTGGANIGGNYFTDRLGAPSSNFVAPQYGGTQSGVVTSQDWGGYGVGYGGDYSSNGFGYMQPSPQSYTPDVSSNGTASPILPDQGGNGVYSGGGIIPPTVGQEYVTRGGFTLPDTGFADNTSPGVGQIGGGQFTSAASPYAVTPNTSSDWGGGTLGPPGNTSSGTIGGGFGTNAFGDAGTPMPATSGGNYGGFGFGAGGSPTGTTAPSGIGTSFTQTPPGSYISTDQLPSSSDLSGGSGNSVPIFATPGQGGFGATTPYNPNTGTPVSSFTSPNAGGFGGTAGAGGQITPGPGMPVSDAGLAKAASSAGTDISKAISDPLSKSVSGAGQQVDTGLNTLGSTISSALTGWENYLGNFFVYAAILITGVIMLYVGLTKFGGAKQQIAIVK